MPATSFLLFPFTGSLSTPLLPYLNFLPQIPKFPSELYSAYTDSALGPPTFLPSCPLLSNATFHSQQISTLKFVVPKPLKKRKKTKSREFSHWVSMTVLNSWGTSHHESTAPSGSCSSHLPHILIDEIRKEMLFKKSLLVR